MALRSWRSASLLCAALLATAKSGDVPAARELLQRLLGPPEALDLVERLDQLEQMLERLSSTRN